MMLMELQTDSQSFLVNVPLFFFSCQIERGSFTVVRAGGFVFMSVDSLKPRLDAGWGQTVCNLVLIQNTHRHTHTNTMSRTEIKSNDSASFKKMDLLLIFGIP